MSDDLTALSRILGERYLIERELGRGGMGAVYLARDRRLDRPVALKVLPNEYASVPELRERFLRETRLAAGFSHPNIVPVFAIEETDEILAFAMGFVEGESLASRVARDGPLTGRNAVSLLQDVGYALAYAHGRGVVHRDIKPDNVMIERATGRALVMDFGIARAITPVTDKPGLTRVGEVVGTPEYMSPEQAAGEAVDGRADLYSLGLVAWFALTARTAMEGETTQRILVRQLTEPVPPMATQRSDLPAALCDVVDRCCAKEAADRFPTAEALVDALDAAQLAAPAVPIAVRLLAPELSTVVMRSIAALVLLSYGVYRIVALQTGNLVALGVIVSAMAFVAGMSVRQEVRRLARSGFAVHELQRLLAVVQLERDEERAQRARDPALVALRRRRVLAAGAALLILGTTLVVWIKGAVQGGDARLDGDVAILRFFGSLLGCAVSITVLISSPFRRPVGERLLGAIWLRPIGVRLLRAMAGAHAGGAAPPARTPAPPARATAVSTTSAQRAHAPVPPASLQTLAADVSNLKERIAALEARQR